MIGSLIFNLTALTFSFAGSKKGKKIFLAIGFIIIFIFYAIRFDYGNDLPSYREWFEIIRDNPSMSSVVNSKSGFEIGYLVLNIIFSKIGFNFMLSFLAATLLFGYYKAIIKIVPRKYYFLAMLILIFNPNLLLVQSSAIRQTIGIAIFFLSIRFLFERKLIPYLLYCILAMQFHSSAVILIPFYFLLTPKRISFIFSVILIIIYFILIFKGKEILRESIQSILKLSNLKYMVYANSSISETKINSGLKAYFNIIILIMISWFGKNSEGYSAIAIKGAIYASIVVTFSMGFPLAGRLAMYFEPFYAMALPYSISKAENKLLGITTGFLYSIYILLTYGLFFFDPIWKDGFMYYTTLFFK